MQIEGVSACIESGAWLTAAHARRIGCLLLAGIVGCSTSDAPPADMGTDQAVACGFVTETECPEECTEFGGYQLTDEPDACLPMAGRGPTWCGDPEEASLGAVVCRTLPTGELLLLMEIPGDLPAGSACGAEFCL